MAVGIIAAAKVAKRVSKKGRAEAKEKKAVKLYKKAERKNNRADRLTKRAEKKMGQGKMVYPHLETGSQSLFLLGKQVCQNNLLVLVE